MQRDRIGPLLLDGLIATCPIVDLAVLFSAQSLSDYEAILVERRALASYAITEAVTDRAIDVQHQLAKRGQHRLSIPELLIAAVAEANDPHRPAL
jgi:predicted nucleic acid-binding protein